MTHRTKPDTHASLISDCTVIIFPLHKRIGKVRHIALLYFRKGKKDAESYWGVQCNAMFRKLLLLGCTQAEADAELLAFHGAVSAELTRLTYLANNNPPDGAA